jgi:tyrosine-specific transport protein
MDAVSTKEGTPLGATLLITGSCIGAGMIGLPVVSAMAGFMPSLLAMLLCYFFATATGLLILEATLWFDQRVNLISMAGFALGKAGRVFTWTLFLFLFYCLFVAYMDGGGRLISNMLSTVFFRPIAREIGIMCGAAFVGAIVYGGTKAVSNICRIFLLGLVISFCVLLSLGLPHIEGKKLLYTNWKAAYTTIPILLLCFGYQNMIPTITYYVKKNAAAVRTAIFVGNGIPFLIYSAWNFSILGILPDGNSLELSQIVSQSDMVTGLLERASQSESVLFAANTFSFFAILTPFMTNTMAFVDFLKDGLKFSGKSKYEIIVYALALVPPTIISILFPHLFLKALSVAGGFADVLLFGFLPVLIVWRGRYVKNIKGPYTAPGGKIFLIIILLLSWGFLLISN